MDYPTPPPTPPQHTNISTHWHPPSFGWLDHIFRLQHGERWSLHQFYSALLCNRLDSYQFGIVSVQRRKRSYNNFQHEFVVLDAIPLVPGTNTPQANASHTYIEVGRSGDEAQMSFFGILGPASDQVLILRQEDEVNITCDQGTEPDDPSNRIATLSWEIDLPNLLDVFSVITLLSVTFPNYNIFTRPCYWFARAIYDVLRYGYEPVFENTCDGFRKGEKFYIFARILTPKPPTNLYLLCRRYGEYYY